MSVVHGYSTASVVAVSSATAAPSKGTSLLGIPRRTAARWFGHGAAAVLDQGLYGIANFGLNVALARILDAPEYGAFATAYSLFLLISIGHTALITQPLIVFGAGKYESRQLSYLNGVLVGHWLLTAVASAVLLVIAVCLEWAGQGLVAGALGGVALASPFLLLQWLMRRICYVRRKPGRAALAGGWYVVLLMSGLYLLWSAGRLSVMSAIALMTVASVVSVLPIVLSVTRIPRQIHFREILTDHIRFGRWAVATGFVEVFGQNVYFLVLPLIAGLESAAALKALMNLEMPLLQAFSALSVLLVGALVRMQGTSEFTRVIRRIGLLFTAVALAYWLLLGLNADRVFDWVYDGRYSSQAPVLWIIGLLPVAAGLSGVIGAAFHALRRPDVLLRAAIIGGSVAIISGVALSVWVDVAGAAAGLVLAPWVTVVALTGRLRWLASVAAAPQPIPAV